MIKIAVITLIAVLVIMEVIVIMCVLGMTKEADEQADRLWEKEADK